MAPTKDSGMAKFIACDELDQAHLMAFDAENKYFITVRTFEGF